MSGRDRVIVGIVSVGGLGLIRRAPGTWGSIPPAIAAFLMMALGASPTATLMMLGVVGFAASVLCVALTPDAERIFSRPDPRTIVLDEVAGMALALIPAPIVVAEHGVFAAMSATLAAFALFRLLDIAKPGLIDSSQRLPRGWGVLADDLLAGAITAGILYVGAVVLFL